MLNTTSTGFFTFHHHIVFKMCHVPNSHIAFTYTSIIQWIIIFNVFVELKKKMVKTKSAVMNKVMTLI